MTVTVWSTDPRAVKALALLAQSSTWTHGRRKCDALAFAIVPGSAPGTTYLVSELGCTCADANRRAVRCKHQTAYRLWTIQQQATAPAPEQGPAPADDVGLCTDAELDATMLEIKAEHLVGDADRADRAARAAHRARLRRELGMTDEEAA